MLANILHIHIEICKYILLHTNFIKFGVLPYRHQHFLFEKFHNLRRRSKLTSIHIQSVWSQPVSREPHVDLEGPGKMATTGRKATNLPHPNKWFLSNFPSEHLASCKFFFFSDVYTGKIYVDSWTERHRKERCRNESIVLSLPTKTEHFGSGLKDSQDDSILSARAVRWSFWCWPFCSPVFFFCGCLVLAQQDLHKPT